MKAKLHVSKERAPAASLESAPPRYSRPKYGPGDYVRIEIILGGEETALVGRVLITATMSIRSSSGLLLMIVLMDLARRSQQDRRWRRASIEYEIQTLTVDTALLPQTCHICQF